MKSKDDLMKITASRLQELRKRNKLSHQRLSESLEKKYGIKISKSSLINYEADDFHSRSGSNAGMKAEYLRCLADFYGVSADYILGTSDIESPDISVQTVAKYTGLSENAVKRLYELKQQERKYENNEFSPIAILSRLLEHRQLHVILFQYLLLYFRVDDAMQFIQSLTDGKITNSDEQHEMIDVRQQIEFANYQLFQKVTDSANLLFRADSVLAECNAIYNQYLHDSILDDMGKPDE